MEDDVSYFMRRASQQREAAMRSSDLRARQAHLEMADRYQDLATSIEARERFLAVDLDGPIGVQQAQPPRAGSAGALRR